MKAAVLFDVSGLATIVTGGASGIGLAYAGVMAQNGARVTIMDADSKALDDVVERFCSAGQDVQAKLSTSPTEWRSIEASTRRHGIMDTLMSSLPMPVLAAGPAFSSLTASAIPTVRSRTFRTTYGTGSSQSISPPSSPRCRLQLGA